MFGSKKKGPTREFTHAPDCPIVRADPSYVPPWQELETGVWSATCVCGREVEREASADHRVRLDPLDPATARHGAVCDHRDTTDPALLRAILRVTPGDGYTWVQCGTCDYGWQVPDYGAD